MNRPVLRVFCSIHKRAIAMCFHDEGTLMVRAGNLSTALGEWTADVVPAKCPRCDAYHMMAVGQLRRAIASGDHILTLPPTSYGVLDYEPLDN